MIGLIRTARQDQRGSYLIEFAFLVLPMMTFILGAIEIGYFSYVKARVEGTLREVSRLSSTGYFVTEAESEDEDDEDGGEDDDDAPPTALELITKYIKADLATIPGAVFDVDIKSYQDFQDIENPEPITHDAEPLGGEPDDVGDCFVDVDGDGAWTRNIAGEDGVGGAEDIVYFGLEVKYAPLLGLSRTFTGDHLVIDLNAAIKNEPFSNAASYSREEICITD